jgi:NAD-dependent dihydropyrimidine dehydrogenase PreA subunit
MWHNLMEYETKMNIDIPHNNFIAVCSYPLGNLSSSKVTDIIKRHQLAIAKDNGGWQVFNTINQENLPGFLKQAAGSPDIKLNDDIIFSRPVIYPEKCNGCGICTAVCEKGILYLDNQKIAVRAGISCDWCTICEAVCPAGAIACPFDIA